MKKYLTIKADDNYYRMLQFEQSKKDGGIYIRHIYHLHSKSSYHTNYGNDEPPFEYHLRGCSGKIIKESVQQLSKLITEYTSAFSKHYFNEWPKNQIILKPSEQDVILDLTGKKFKSYELCLFSEKRSDLLEREYDNAVIVLIPLRYHNFIAGCFDH